ncbi:MULTISPECIES: flagellar biosynthesis protein FlhF [Streptomyces]|uniref:hypothetical protein n=1 Tax=Streptomyces TaxID=1883 RepID=UPI00163BD426|nr:MULTISPECIES: hypothetical protein [Streptomyces]MBC2878484.1 hypothetical protein [Streptomyces sp. TYQ1024]UBI38813.1 hypothetical protein K7I03_21730 [Streptomyces mobaraensis]UKW31393.1 hypothetical protein MCU78_21675 [Streptomyces sp. TYQ1024]
MAVANPSADARPYAPPKPPAPQQPPMAGPGYGKRSAPDQAPRSAGDFAHLPAREAYIAAHLDRLPDGAAMDHKTLARELPYGQQAVRTALRVLSEAGHLRVCRERVSAERTQWVSRTYFSRTARDDAWWSAFLRGDVPQATRVEAGTLAGAVAGAKAAAGTDAEAGAVATAMATADEATPDAAPAPPSRPSRPSRRSPALDLLASVGHADPRMALSARECAALEPLAAEWLARGASPAAVRHALVNALPDVVAAPGAFARRRLTDRMPPEGAAPRPERQPAPRRIVECTNCHVPGPPEALPGGLCRVCHGTAPAAGPSPEAEDAVRRRVDELRAVVRDRPRAPARPPKPRSGRG